MHNEAYLKQRSHNRFCFSDDNVLKSPIQQLYTWDKQPEYLFRAIFTFWCR